ncbi:ATP-grasp domain-containing protein [Candidatus Woesearchaeota archaeon]|nr:ATP-grasp domain-containing protein [Candidatus Woesearchaeota archaeon]
MTPYRNDGLRFSNVRIDPEKAYVLFVGDCKYIATTALLSEMLSKRYGRQTEIINILPNMPPPYMNNKGNNFIVINNRLYNNTSHKAAQPCILPLDQPEINWDVSRNDFVKKTVDKILETQDDLYINLFKSTPEMTLPDHDERIKVIGPRPDLFTRFDNKLHQRHIVEELGIPVPRGRTVDSFEELVKTYKEDFNGDAFIACANGFGGNGTEPVSCLDDILYSRKIKGKNEFIISELLNLGSSPCSLGIVANDDEVLVASIADQLMDGVNYGGTVYPSAAGMKKVKEMEEYTEKIGKHLGSEGYRGFFGVDFMIDSKDNLYFVEINPRKIGSTPETILAHRTTNPERVSLPELEFLAVTEGTFRTDISRYSMPDIHWGVKGVKAKKGQRTVNYTPMCQRESEIFRDYGTTILDHPGQSVLYLDEGRVARIVCVRDQYSPEARQDIISELNRGSARIMLEKAA